MNRRAPDWLTYNYHSFLLPILLRILVPYVRYVVQEGVLDTL